MIVGELCGVVSEDQVEKGEKLLMMMKNDSVLITTAQEANNHNNHNNHNNNIANVAHKPEDRQKQEAEAPKVEYIYLNLEVVKEDEASNGELEGAPTSNNSSLTSEKYKTHDAGSSTKNCPNSEGSDSKVVASEKSKIEAKDRPKEDGEEDEGNIPVIEFKSQPMPKTRVGAHRRGGGGKITGNNESDVLAALLVPSSANNGTTTTTTATTNNNNSNDNSATTTSSVAAEINTNNNYNNNNFKNNHHYYNNNNYNNNNYNNNYNNSRRASGGATSQHRRTLSEPMKCQSDISFAEAHEMLRQYQLQLQQQQALLAMQSSLLAQTQQAACMAMASGGYYPLMEDVSYANPMMMMAAPTSGYSPNIMNNNNMHRGGGGHQRSRSDGVATMRCYNCDGFGHFSKECPMACSFCRMPGHWSGNCMYAPTKQQQQQAAAAMAAQQQPDGIAEEDGSGEEGSVNIDSNTGLAPSVDRSTLRCFNCGMVGHRSVHCVMPCQYCGQVGHWSGICSLRPDNKQQY